MDWVACLHLPVYRAPFGSLHYANFILAYVRQCLLDHAIGAEGHGSFPFPEQAHALIQVQRHHIFVEVALLDHVIHAGLYQPV